MEQRNTAQNGRYIFHIHDELAKQYHGKYFTRHSGIIALGIVSYVRAALPLRSGCDKSLRCFRRDAFDELDFFCGLIWV